MVPNRPHWDALAPLFWALMAYTNQAWARAGVIPTNPLEDAEGSNGMVNPYQHPPTTLYKEPQIPSSRDHKALNGGTSEGLGTKLQIHGYCLLWVYMGLTVSYLEPHAIWVSARSRAAGFKYVPSAEGTLCLAKRMWASYPSCSVVDISSDPKSIWVSTSAAMHVVYLGRPWDTRSHPTSVSDPTMYAADVLAMLPSSSSLKDEAYASPFLAQRLQVAPWQVYN